MKRRLNILCVIVLLVLGYSVLETTYYVGLGIKTGIEKGFDSKIDAKAKEEISNVQVVQLVPKDLGGDILIDSVYNEKTGEYVPAAYGQMIVSVNTQPSVLSRIVSLLILILNYVAIVWAVVLFIRLIVSINKSDIFNWKNVRRLRRLGVLLIIGFVCTFLLAFLSFHNVEKVFFSDRLFIEYGGYGAYYFSGIGDFSPDCSRSFRYRTENERRTGIDNLKK